MNNDGALGRSSISGTLWAMTSGLFVKTITLASQFVLSYLLFPEDYGLVSIALGAAAVSNAVSWGGMKELLVQRHERLAEEAGQVFWLTFACNLVLGLAIALAGPVLAARLGDPRLIPLMAIVALARPLDAFMTVPMAQIQSALKFRELAFVVGGKQFVMAASSIALAWGGCGPASLVWPLVVGGLWTALVARLLAPRLSVGRPQPGLWWGLIAPSCWLMLIPTLLALQQNGPNFIIGFAQDPGAAGYYVWGVMVASQVVYLISGNLRNVFLPIFAKLKHDPERQYQGFLRALEVMSFVVAPLCVAQSLAAPALIRLVFGDKWQPAEDVVRWYSLGLALEPVALLGACLAKARGAFSLLTAATAAQASLMLAATLAGVWAGFRPGAIGLLTAAALVLGNLGGGAAMLGRLKLSVADFLGVVAPPLAAGGIGLLAGLALQAQLHGAAPLVQIVVPPLAPPIIAVALWGLTSPAGLWNLVQRLRRATAK